MRYGKRSGRTLRGGGSLTDAPPQPRSPAASRRLLGADSSSGLGRTGLTCGDRTNELCPRTKLTKPECSCVECWRELTATSGVLDAARRTGNERAPDGASRQLALPAQASGLAIARRFVDSAAADLGLDEVARHEVVTAANEAVSNAIRHGAPFAGGVIYLSTSVQDDELVCTVRDAGCFDLLDGRAPDPAAEHGRGFPLMRRLVDEVVIDASPQGTIVRLSRRAGHAPARR